MARALRWRGTFMSLNGITCTVNIYDEGWSGGVSDLTLADNPFIFEEDDSENLLNVVRTKTGYLRVVEHTYDELTDLFPQTDTEHYITVSYGSSVVFVGFIQSQSFDQEYAPGPRVLSLPVVSPLGTAKGLRFSSPSVPSYQTIASVLKNCVDILDAGIVKLTFPDYIISNSERTLSLRMNTLSYCPFNSDYNIYVGSTETLYSPQTVGEFIESLCKCFGLMVHDLGTEIIFTRYDYVGVYNQYIVNTMDSSSPSYQAITNGSNVINITSAPKSNESKESTILPANKIEINYQDEINPTYEIPYKRSKAYTYGDNWVILTPSTDELSSPYFVTNTMPTTNSNSVAVCSTNGSNVESGFKEMIMFSRVGQYAELFTWKLYNIPKYSNRGCRITFLVKSVVWHQVDGKYYYDTDVAASNKSLGVRIKNGAYYFQSNGTWAASADVLYRNTDSNGRWILTIWTAMNSLVDPLEITFFFGANSGVTSLFAIEDVKIEPIQKGITGYVSGDIGNKVVLMSNNGVDKEISLDQTINVKRKSEDALINTNGY